METLTPTTNDIAATGSAGLSIDSLPTLAGAVPPALAAQFKNVPAPSLPEVARLPRPRERCPLTGASRQWLIDRDNALPRSEKFLFRIRTRGKIRGVVFINVPRLFSFLKSASETNIEGEV